MTYTINSGLIPKLNEKFEKFQKKFKKFGNGNFIYELSEPTINIQTHEEVVQVNVECNYKIEGYEIIATLDFDELTQQNIIKNISSYEIPKEYRTSTRCDHCNSNVRRIHTVLLRNTETGNLVQVGKSCLKDYLGCSLENYASYLSIWNTIEEYIENCNREFASSFKRTYDCIDILEQTIGLINKYGYVSKKMCYDDEYSTLIPTTTRLYTLIFEDREYKTGKLIEPRFEVTDEIKTKTEELVDYIKNSEDTDWNNNLKILLANKEITSDKIGMLASSYGGYIYHLKKLEEQTKQNKIPSNWVGNIGDKVQITATPITITSYYTEWGETFIYKFIINNNIYIWKTSKSLADKEITIKGTLVEQNEFRGEKQNVLSRCRIV